MELRQLEYFLAVAEESNFTRAAERVHVAQPAVSAQIRRLERELGQPLLDRSRRAARLTAAGATRCGPGPAGRGGCPRRVKPRCRSRGPRGPRWPMSKPRSTS